MRSSVVYSALAAIRNCTAECVARNGRRLRRSRLLS